MRSWPSLSVWAAARQGPLTGRCGYGEAAAGQVDRTLEGHSGLVMSVAFSPDGGKVASGSADGTVRSRTGPTSTRREEESTAPRCWRLQLAATTRSCSGCSSTAPTSTRKGEESTAPRCRRLQLAATTRSCSGCSSTGPSSTSRGEESTAPRCRRLQLVATTRSSSG
jgi:WD40 repeat protein